MHHYPFHVADYVVSTAHLSPVEDVTYRRLIDLYYTTEKPIPLETQWVARRIRMETQMVESILKEFFEMRDDGYHNDRCDMELERYFAICERNKTNGKAGGRPKKTKSEPSGLPLETQTKANQEPRTKKQIKYIDDPRFDVFWEAYPRKTGKQQAKREWLKAGINGDFDSIMAALERQKQSKKWKEGYIFNPVNWIKDRHWEDELEIFEEPNHAAGAL